MKLSEYIGTPLRGLAKVTGYYDKGYVVFLLRDSQDNTGRRIRKDFSIRLVLHHHPELAECEVVYAENYYGELILRVKEVTK